MDSQPTAEMKDQAANAAASNGNEPSLDPLRRYHVAREYQTPNGTTVFKTLDGQLYMRHTDGSIRVVNKLRGAGKASRKARAQARRTCRP